MLSKIKKSISPKVFYLVLFAQLLFIYFITEVNAQCPDNVVPNPIDPDCSQSPITFGLLVTRIVGFVPYIVAIAAVASYVWGSIKVIMAKDADGRQEGITIWINTTIGVSLFAGIWLVLFIVSVITGFDLLSFLG
jgi:hypothetical protein